MILKNKYPILWLLLVIFYLLDISLGISILSCIFLISLIFNLGNKDYFLQNLTYAILLSPALISVQIGSTQLIFSDLFIFFGSIFLIFKNIVHNKKITYNFKSSFLVKLFISIFLFNFFQTVIFSVIGEYTNYKFQLYIFFHIILFFALLSIDINYKHQKLLLKSFLISVFFAIIIVLNYYIRGESLLAWSGGDFASASDLPEYLFFRATYFYSGFPLYLGCSIALLGYLVFNNQVLYKTRFLICLVLFVEIIAAIAFINKTVFVALVGTTFLIQFYKFRYNFLKFLKSILIKSFIVLSVIFSLIMVVDFSLFRNFIAYSTQTGSLMIRFYIYFNSIKLILSDPFNFFFGEGLGFLSSNEPKRFLYTKNELGQTEGTIDSQFMNILIETGIIGFFLVFCFVFAVSYRLYKLKRADEKFAIPIVIMFIMIAIICITQRMGMAKLSLILPILTALVAKYQPEKI